MNKEIVQTLIAVRKEALRILDRQLIVVSLNFQYQVLGLPQCNELNASESGTLYKISVVVA
jgi:hypothetical protein